MLVRLGSNQTALPAVLPNLMPADEVSSGVVKPKAVGGASGFRALMRFISDMPARMLPHWSEPPIWMEQPNCWWRW
jgi:hypothetical protein